MYQLNERINDYTIVGMTTSEVFILQMGGKSDFTNLDLIDRDWRQKPIYIVKFDTPRKNMSMDDLQRIYPDMNYFDLKMMYDSLPLYQFQSLVEAAIEVKT